MTDKKTEDSGVEAKDGKLDSGPSPQGDSRENNPDYDDVKLNEPGADFSHLKDTLADNPDLPLDNTPAGKALGHSDGRPMTQDEAHESETQVNTKNNYYIKVLTNTI